MTLVCGMPKVEEVCYMKIKSPPQCGMSGFLGHMTLVVCHDYLCLLLNIFYFLALSTVTKVSEL